MEECKPLPDVTMLLVYYATRDEQLLYKHSNGFQAGPGFWRGVRCTGTL